MVTGMAATMFAAAQAEPDAVRGPLVKVTDATRARVDCGTPGPDGVECVVKRTAGEDAVNVCWQLAITCQNGGVMEGRACDDLAVDDGQVTTTMPVAAFSNQAGCDVPQNGEVRDLVVKGLE
jgi:hypothetical protein